MNPSDDVVPLPADKEEGDPISLPANLIFGKDCAALTLAWEAEKPAAIRGPSCGELNGQLRLGPRTAIGAQVDLRPLTKTLRYSGEYTLEWRPFGENGPVATTHFRIEARKNVVLITDFGKMTFTLNYEKAPRNVENFLDLVRTRAYDGVAIHRIIANYLVQGGSPDGTRQGARPDGKTVVGEFEGGIFDVGTLAMAHKPNDPNSASAQFFVTLARVPELDGKYTVVGMTHDEDSLRTLRQISEQPVDKDDHPVRPVMIRFATLIDAEPTTSEHIEVSRP